MGTIFSMEPEIYSQDGNFESIAEKVNGRWVMRKKMKNILVQLFPLIYLKKFTSKNEWLISNRYIIIRNKNFILFECGGIFYFSFPTVREYYNNNQWNEWK